MWLGVWLLVGSVTFLVSRRSEWSWSKLLPTIQQWLRIKDVTDKTGDGNDRNRTVKESRTKNTQDTEETQEDQKKPDEPQPRSLPSVTVDKTSESPLETSDRQQGVDRASDPRPSSSTKPRPAISVPSAAAGVDYPSVSGDASHNNPVKDQPLPPKPSAPSRSTTTLMPPPPVPSRAYSTGPSNRPSPSIPKISTANRNLLQLPRNTAAPRRKQIPLTPGHSPLDWAALTSRPNESTSARLRGRDATELCEATKRMYLRIPPSMLREHDGRNGRDAWTSFSGRVYNITAYLPFHLGGRGELMRCAGKDGRKLFDEVHPWVNWEGMLGECFIGILVAENATSEREDGGVMDEMD